MVAENKKKLDSSVTIALHFKELGMKREMNSLKDDHKKETVALKKKTLALTQEKVEVAAFHRAKVQTLKDTHANEIKVR